MMSSDQIREIIVNELIETYSNMAFLEVVESKDKVNVAHDNIFMIECTDPIRLVIYLFMPESLRRLIASNIYGESIADLKENEIDDSLLEILNVLAGAIIDQILGKYKKFKINFPKFIYDFNNENMKDLIEVHFNAEDHPLVLMYRYENRE